MNDAKTIKSIRRFAKEMGFRIFSVGFYHKWTDKNIQTSPLDLIKWFYNAEFVFTDTFHGTVLSLITNTQFLSKISNNQNKLAFLLEQLKLSYRNVSDFSEIDSKVKTPIDYNSVNRLLDDLRNNSKTLLENAIFKDGK